MNFYKLTYEEFNAIHVVADDDVAEDLYRYVPTTGLWHVDRKLEPQFLFGDDGATFTPISATEAAHLLSKATKLDLRYTMARALQKEREAQISAAPGDVRTSAEMGLTMDALKNRPTKAPGLKTLLESQPGKHAVALYDTTQSSRTAPLELRKQLTQLQLSPDQKVSAHVAVENGLTTVTAEALPVQAKVESPVPAGV
ncbi:MAG: hypothetical protein ACTII7_09800 [Galactobacter sp.]